MIARAITFTAGLGLQLVGLYAAVVTFGALITLGLYAVGVLAVLLQHVVAQEDPMFTWGVIVFVGLWLLLADVAPGAPRQAHGQPVADPHHRHRQRARHPRRLCRRGDGRHRQRHLQRAVRALSTTVERLYPGWHLASRHRAFPRPKEYDMSTTAARDLYAETTARIIAALEQGAAPWVKPWSTGIDTLPMNASSRRLYRGINALLLGIEASTHGYPLNRWLTYRQASELGGQVRKGEHGTTVVLWRLRKVAATSDVYPEPEIQDLHERVIPLLRAFTVFNVAQVEGVPAALQAVEQHHLGARGARRGTAAHVRRHHPARRLPGVLPARRRRDPPAAASGVPRCRALLRDGAA